MECNLCGTQIDTDVAVDKGAYIILTKQFSVPRSKTMGWICTHCGLIFCYECAMRNEKREGSKWSAFLKLHEGYKCWIAFIDQRRWMRGEKSDEVEIQQESSQLLPAMPKDVLAQLP